MASIRREEVVAVPTGLVWDAVRDVGAVHERLLPGRVSSTFVEGDVRVLTFPDGHTVTELIVAIDDKARRLAYTVVEGARPPLLHHHATFDVLPIDRASCRLIWVTDVLPHDAAGVIAARMEAGVAEMRRTLEGRPAP